MFDKITDILLESSPLLSWSISLLGIFLFLSPLIIGRWLLKRYLYKFMMTGFILGLIAFPLSLWLAQHYYIEGARVALGVVGAIILLFHQLPFNLMAVYFPSLYKLNFVFGSIFWAIVYGIVGLIFDIKRIKIIKKGLTVV